MTKKFVSFHSVVRGTRKSKYLVLVAEKLVEKQFKVLLLDGHIYQPGGLAHKITDILGVVLKYEQGQSLYELINDHEVLRSAGLNPSAKEEKKLLDGLSLRDVEIYNGFFMPDVVGRIIHLQEQGYIDVMLGSDPQNINIKQGIDLVRMFKKNYGDHFITYVKERLAKLYDFILIDAQVGFAPMSGLLCGKLSDIFMAFDVDNPIYEHLPSYQVGLKLAEKINEGEQINISVKSVRGKSVDQMVKLILDENKIPESI